MGRAPKRLWAYTKPKWLCLSSYAIVKTAAYNTKATHEHTHSTILYLFWYIASKAVQKNVATGYEQQSQSISMMSL